MRFPIQVYYGSPVIGQVTLSSLFTSSVGMVDSSVCLEDSPIRIGTQTLGRKRVLIPLALNHDRGDLIEEAVLFMPNS
jgi:hypothetical protein